ncbi:MAG: hypothetical protein ABMA15_17070 [Vicinamibacterales bacterium]
MTERSCHPPTLAGLLLAGIFFLLHVPASFGQPIPTARTGQPDLHGLWVNNTATPLERPRTVNGRPAFTEAEAKDYESRYQLDRTVAISRNKSFELDAAGDLDTYEPGPLLPGRRTSMINDPADGAVPPLTPAAQRRLTERNEHLNAHYADNPEDLTFAERCLIVANTSVPPMMPAFYNNTLQIVQTADTVLLVSEQIHDTRVISLTRRTHLPSSIRRWSGDSIGRWEGKTLVVDTTNFTTQTTLRGSGTGLHLIERFSLSDSNTLKYEFTVDDPASFTRSWSADSQLSRTDQMMYEFACHEANYSMSYILRGARFAEKNR